MSKPKSSQSYPPEFFTLVKKVGLEGNEVKVAFAKRAQAVSLRQQFFGFRSALRKESLGSDEQIAADGMTTALLVEGEKFIVLFFPIDAKALRDALATIN